MLLILTFYLISFLIEIIVTLYKLFLLRLSLYKPFLYKSLKTSYKIDNKNKGLILLGIYKVLNKKNKRDY